MNSANDQHGSISSSGLKAPAWVLALGLILATFIVAGLMIYLAVNDKQWSWRLDSFGVIQQEANPEDVKQFCEEQENLLQARYIFLANLKRKPSQTSIWARWNARSD